MAGRLVAAGADPMIPGWMRLTALDRAADRKRPDGRKVLAMLESAVGRRRR